jgi:hypothetical protein
MGIAKGLRLWSVGVATLCLAYASVSSARPISGAPLQANEGIVLLSIANNTGLVGQFARVVVEQVPDPNARRSRKNNEALINITEGLGRDTAMYIGIVPAGDYNILRLDNPARWLDLNGPAQTLLGTVRVEAGAVADLGRIVVTPIRANMLVGRSRVATSNIAFVRRFWPEHAAHLERPVVPGWTSLHATDDVVEAYALDRPVDAEAPIELPSGEVLVASRLGTLMFRSLSGVWRATRTAGIESLLFVAPIPSGEVDGQPAIAVAVGEYNTIVRVEPEDRSLWWLGAGNLPPGTLLFVGGNADSGWYVAQRQAGSQVSIYRSARLDGGEWELVRTVSVDSKFWAGSDVFWIWPTTSGLAYAVFEGSIHELDYATSAWTERQSPNGDRLVEVIGRADGTISVITTPGGVGGMSRSVYVSRNGGADWTLVDLPSQVRYLPRVLPDGSLLTIAGKLMKPELQTSADGGVTWTVRSDAFRTEENIVVLPTRGLLAIDIGQPPLQTNPYVSYVGLGNARIRHSADGGATWRVEYSNWQ